MMRVLVRGRRARTLSTAIATAACLLATAVPATAGPVNPIAPQVHGHLRLEPSPLQELRLTARPGPASGPFAAAAPSASASVSSSLASQLQARADALVAAGATGVVGRVVDARGVTQVAAGVADRVSGRPARTGDTFEIGSITKTFMATLALQLVAQRRLRLDDTVERWLPGVVPGGDQITVRMLLNHTSGLFDYTDDLAAVAAIWPDPTQVVTPRQLVDVATAHAPYFAPGTSWTYSNTNYVLVGMILQAVTGLAPRDLLTRWITGPLRLAHTVLADQAPVGDRPGSLHGYLLSYLPDGVAQYTDVSVISMSWLSTAGAMISTTADVSRFFAALLGGRLLPPAQLRQMETTVTVPDSGGALRYGLGLLQVDTVCGTAWGHDGVTLGHLSTALFTPDGRRGMVTDASTRPAAWGLPPAPGTPDEQFLAADTALGVTQICAALGQPVPQ